EYASDNKYGYDPDYPINIGFIHEKQEEINIEYYFNGLEGPNGEKISYKKVDTCCPFPSKNSLMGAGTIGIYEVSFEGSSKKITLYFNIFEKGKILCPKGFAIKKPVSSNN
ncbi:MAG: 2-dehydro-3-deoxyphosphooctonate aldolase, partial [Flavobacterium sp.]|nr:2-dehydro-3-deoxyphosphooctonate aldolase [Flavobacterium sp.]